MDLSKFKKVASNKTHTVFQNDEGHQLHVAHKAVDEKTKGKLKGLPQGLQAKHASLQHFDQGGQAQPQPPKNPVSQGFTQATGQSGIQQAWNNLVGQQPVQHKADGGDIKDKPYMLSDFANDAKAGWDRLTTPIPSTYNEMSTDVGGTPDQNPANAPAPAPAPTNYQLPQQPQGPVNPDPYGMKGYDKMMTSGYQQQKAGINNEAKAQGAMGDASAKMYQNAIEGQGGLQDIGQQYQQTLQNLNNEHNALITDIQQGHINPTHYVDSMSTGKKIGMGIGLLLGGLGSNGNAMNNPALQSLQKNIDRDIDSQKAELGKKENLLSANMKQYGNMRDAVDATRANSIALVSARIKQFEATATSPLAKARAQQAAGALDMQVAPIFQSIAQRKAILSGMSTGQVDPAQVITALVPKEHQDAALKELGRSQDVQASESNLMSNWDKANQDNTLANRIAHFGYEPASIKNLRALTLPMIHDQEGRVNEFEQKTLEDLMPSPGDRPDKIQAKRQGMLEFIRSKQATPTLNAYGIHLPQPASSSSIRPGVSSNYKKR